MDALDNLYTVDSSSIRRLMQVNAGRRAFSTFFNKDHFMNLMIINFENAASHKYVVQKAKGL